MLTQAIALAALLCPADAATQEDPRESEPLVGRWELSGKWVADGLSSIVDFLPGGWYSQTLVMKTRLRYDYDGSRLILTGVDPAGNALEASRATLDVVFAGDTLVAKSGFDVIRMIRFGGDQFSRGILGRWVSTNDEGKGVIQDFGYDGFVNVAVTLSGEAGRYSINKDKIEWEPRVPASGKRRTKFSLKGNKLVLAPERGGSADELVRLR